MKMPSNIVRTTFIAVYILFLFTYSQAQTKKTKNPRWNWQKHQTEVINYAKKYLVSEIEPNVPQISFEKWFKQTVGEEAKIEWEINDCGEKTGTSADSNDFSMCVEAKALKPQFVDISVTIQFGNFKQGITKMKPVVRTILAGDELSAEWVKNLSDLPKVVEIHEKTRIYLNPNRGSFQLSGQPPAGFENFYEMWVHTIEYDEKGKFIVIKANGGMLIGEKFYKVNGYYSDRKVWNILTMEIDGVSYKFDGKFAKLKFDSNGAVLGDNVLQGHLTKLVNGKMVTEAVLSFNFVLKRPCKGCGQPSNGKK